MIPNLSYRGWVIALGGLSALLLAMAFAFEAAGYRPCELCLLQRWPHAGAGLLALAALLMTRPPRALAWIGGALMLGSMALGIYHSGVEWHLWPGPSSCTGGAALQGLSTQQLLDQIMAAPMVRCDQPALTILGTTMANWNAVASALLAFVWARVAISR